MNTRKQIIDYLTSTVKGEVKIRFDALIKEYLDDIKENTENYNRFLNTELSEAGAQHYLENLYKEINNIKEEME